MKAALVRRLAKNCVSKNQISMFLLTAVMNTFILYSPDRKISNEIELNKKTVFIEKPYSMKSTTNIVL